MTNSGTPGGTPLPPHAPGTTSARRPAAAAPHLRRLGASGRRLLRGADPARRVTVPEPVGGPVATDSWWPFGAVVGAPDPAKDVERAPVSVMLALPARAAAL